jgi:copper chaperone CopZ
VKQTIQIEGMSCQHCVHAVREALESVEGIVVESVEIGSATVDVGAGVDFALVKQAIEEEGYRTVSIET